MKIINRKRIVILVIIFIAIVLIFNSSRNMVGPSAEDLISIMLIDVADEKVYKKTTISKETDISKLLEIFKDSKRTSKKSISNLPNKTEFTMVIYKFKSGGNSWRSIYEENNNIYIDQPFHGVFKIKSKDIYLLDEIKKEGSEDNFIIPVEDMFREDGRIPH